MGLETFEVWAKLAKPIKQTDGTLIEWNRIAMQRGEAREDTFERKDDAMRAAEAAAESMDNKEIVVIERRPILRLNAKGCRPKAKDESPEEEEERLARKRGEVDSPAGGFRLIKKNKGAGDEDGVRGVGDEGHGDAGAAP